MVNKISYKRKLKLLLISSIFMALVSYIFSISKTIKQYKIYRENSALTINTDATYNIETLREKNQFLDESLAKFVLDTTDTSRTLLSTIAKLCDQNNATLREYKPASVNEGDSLRLLTRSVVLEGKFIDCLKVVYKLETEERVGRIASVFFKSNANPTETMTWLNCTIYIQNIVSSNE
jgi:hypothetical protein